MQKTLTVQDGNCYLFFAFDIGLSIDLERCEDVLKQATERTRLADTRSTH